jgi:tRNA (adenine37-N6)-methyltransferase
LIRLEPIGYVRNHRTELAHDDWGNVRSRIVLADWLTPTSLLGLKDFSHAEIIYVFDRVEESQVEPEARHPRDNPDWPKVGIFAQRGKNRPNRLGATIVALESIEDRTLTVRGLDAIDGTPVVDIKPVMREFLPRQAVEQPQWASELMANYWSMPKK